MNCSGTTHQHLCTVDSNSSGGNSSSSRATHSCTLGSVRSQPCLMSMNSPRYPAFSTCGTSRGGEKISATRYFLPSLLHPFLTCALGERSCFLVIPPAFLLSYWLTSPHDLWTCWMWHYHCLGLGYRGLRSYLKAGDGGLWNYLSQNPGFEDCPLWQLAPEHLTSEHQ